ncbi:MAG: hypothetical protein KGZ81_05810 [Flavobacteriales bacterium]|nr:hypothetical protein [Flavobacteriales bacterium]
MKKLMIAMLVIFCSSILVAGCGDSEQKRKEIEAEKAQKINEQLQKPSPNHKTRVNNTDPLDDYKKADNEIDKI